MKKSFFLAVLLIATTSVAYAQDEKYDGDRVMDIHLVGNQTSSFMVEDIESITFSSGWSTIGIGQYTEDFLASWYWQKEEGDMVVTYEVEIQEKDDTPGLYRLVDPYGAAYPYNDGKKYYDDSWVFYMEINASDPDGVFIKRQETNFTGSPSVEPFKYGQLWVSSWAWEGFLSQGLSLSDAKKQKGVVGKLEDGVITFPQFMTYGYFGEWQMCNWDNAFKVVLP